MTPDGHKVITKTNQNNIQNKVHPYHVPLGRTTDSTELQISKNSA